MDTGRERKYQEVTYEELLDKLKTYITKEEELKVINDAYQFAWEHHKGKKRKSGDDCRIEEGR